MDLHYDIIAEKERAGSYIKLGKLIGMDESPLQKWGQGKKENINVSFKNLSKLSKYYGVAIEDFRYKGQRINKIDYKGSGIEDPNKVIRTYKPKPVKPEKVKGYSSRKKAMEFLKTMFDIYKVEKTVIPNWYIFREAEMVEDMKAEGYKIEYYYTEQKQQNGKIWNNGYVELVGRI